jgi:hypothetical protein
MKSLYTPTLLIVYTKIVKTICALLGFSKSFFKSGKLENTVDPFLFKINVIVLKNEVNHGGSNIN